MQFRERPEVFLLAETRIMPTGIRQMLDAIEPDLGKKWTTNAVSGGEFIAEVAGRLCYKSFEAGLNPNVTRIREGNEEYLGNIINQRHGSVFEHASTTVGMIGVSRVFTHEFVRHRHGSPSQESMRFVRLDKMQAWFPEELGDTDLYSAEVVTQAEGIFREVFEKAEESYKKLVELFDVGKMKDFGKKKRLTSAFRRIAPDGIATNLIVTANHRTWRYIIEARTSEHAEEEIRIVVGDIARKFKMRYPSFYQDMEEVILPEDQDPPQIPVFTFKASKI